MTRISELAVGCPQEVVRARLDTALWHALPPPMNSQLVLLGVAVAASYAQPGDHDRVDLSLFEQVNQGPDRLDADAALIKLAMSGITFDTMPTYHSDSQSIKVMLEKMSLFAHRTQYTKD